MAPRKKSIPHTRFSTGILFTDGSGGTQGTAGWGVGIFNTVNPNITNEWLAALYGPVLTQPWDPLWLGANIHSNNNTAELSAIGEACKWLLDTCSQSPDPSQWEGTILYDSEYAYGIATRLYHPDSNLILAETIASLVDSVRSKRQLHFKHVRGHRGIYGNEVADRLADRPVIGFLLTVKHGYPHHRSRYPRHQKPGPGPHVADQQRRCTRAQNVKNNLDCVPMPNMNLHVEVQVMPM